MTNTFFNFKHNHYIISTLNIDRSKRFPPIIVFSIFGLYFRFIDIYRSTLKTFTIFLESLFNRILRSKIYKSHTFGSTFSIFKNFNRLNITTIFKKFSKSLFIHSERKIFNENTKLTTYMSGSIVYLIIVSTIKISISISISFSVRISLIVSRIS